MLVYSSYTLVTVKVLWIFVLFFFTSILSFCSARVCLINVVFKHYCISVDTTEYCLLLSSLEIILSKTSQSYHSLLIQTKY